MANIDTVAMTGSAERPTDGAGPARRARLRPGRLRLGVALCAAVPAVRPCTTSCRGSSWASLLVLLIRSLGLIPPAALPPIAGTANLLTTQSMAALGLGVDVRVVAKAGPRVAAAVTASLLVLGAIGFGLIRALGVA